MLEQALETHVQAHPDLNHDRGLLQSIQGVLLLPILHPGRFKDAPQAAAYLGLVPVEHQSGTRVKGGPRLSKAGNATVRAKLYMAAIVAARYNPDVKALYERLVAKGKSKMLVLSVPKHRRLVPVYASWHISALVFSSIKPVIYLNLPKFKLSLLKTT